MGLARVRLDLARPGLNRVPLPPLIGRCLLSIHMAPSPADRLLLTPTPTGKAALRVEDPYVSRSLAGTPVLSHHCAEREVSSLLTAAGLLVSRHPYHHRHHHRAHQGSSLSALATATETDCPVLITPSRILDAPGLEDDFYLNLLDWCPISNQLAVGLAEELFLWNAATGKATPVTRLPEDDRVTAVCWLANGILAMGTKAGRLELIDVERSTRLLTIKSHTARIAVLASSAHGGTPHLFSSGGRDRSIVHYDMRCPAPGPNRSSPLMDVPFSSSTAGTRPAHSTPPIMIGRVCGAHQQEVCGLEWEARPGGLLASGGNDNQLFIWDARHLMSPLLSGGTEHAAAIKALAWSPHQRGLLASGGGTADRTIKFWCTRTSSSASAVGDPTPMSSLQTTLASSQVCNMLWSPHDAELITAHGFSEHQCVRWSYPSMKVTGLLRGHEQRILHIALSPDGTTVVTGSGDETLRFWPVFNAVAGRVHPGSRALRRTTLVVGEDHMDIL